MFSIVSFHFILFMPYHLSFPLPEKIKDEISAICYGIPDVNWVETENLHLTLKYLGEISPQQLEDFQESLEVITFSPLLLSLKGIAHHHTRRKKGFLWIGINHSENLTFLKKSIDKVINLQKMNQESKRFHPQVIIAHYNKVSEERLAEFLETNALFKSQPFTIDSICLMEYNTEIFRIPPIAQSNEETSPMSREEFFTRYQKKRF